MELLFIRPQDSRRWLVERSAKRSPRVSRMMSKKLGSPSSTGGLFLLAIFMVRSKQELQLTR